MNKITIDKIPELVAKSKKTFDSIREYSKMNAKNYLNGSNGLPKNRVQAINWLKKAANNGHAQAKLMLAGVQ